MIPSKARTRGQHGASLVAGLSRLQRRWAGNTTSPVWRRTFTREESEPAISPPPPVQQQKPFLAQQSKPFLAQQQKPSLAQQLFPDAKFDQVDPKPQSSKPREIPRLPLNVLANEPSPESETLKYVPYNDENIDQLHKLLAEVAKLPAGSLTPFLYLESASKHLTIADFRRIVPQGQHLEGWHIEHEDVLCVIPGRTSDDLRQLTHYHLIFSSVDAAQRYLEHAKKLHDIVHRYGPRANHPAPPMPEGYTYEGIDVATAIKTYTIMSPDQTFQLRADKAPLPLSTVSMIRNKGPQRLYQRQGILPYELRVSLDGPQIDGAVLRRIFIKSAYDRGMSWSGNANAHLVVATWITGRREGDDGIYTEEGGGDPSKEPVSVYVMGFHTEHAARSFESYWHGRVLAPSTYSAFALGDEAPPIVEIEPLWC